LNAILELIEFLRTYAKNIKCGDIQNGEELNILPYGTPSSVVIHRSYKLPKNCPVLAHPVYVFCSRLASSNIFQQQYYTVHASDH